MKLWEQLADWVFRSFYANKLEQRTWFANANAFRAQVTGGRWLWWWMHRYSLAFNRKLYENLLLRPCVASRFRQRLVTQDRRNAANALATLGGQQGLSGLTADVLAAVRALYFINKTSLTLKQWLVLSDLEQTKIQEMLVLPSRSAQSSSCQVSTEQLTLSKQALWLAAWAKHGGREALIAKLSTLTRQPAWKVFPWRFFQLLKVICYHNPDLIAWAQDQEIQRAQAELGRARRALAKVMGQQPQGKSAVVDRSSLEGNSELVGVVASQGLTVLSDRGINPAEAWRQLPQDFFHALDGVVKTSPNLRAWAKQQIIIGLRHATDEAKQSYRALPLMKRASHQPRPRSTLIPPAQLDCHDKRLLQTRSPFLLGRIGLPRTCHFSSIGMWATRRRLPPGGCDKQKPKKQQVAGSPVVEAGSSRLTARMSAS